MLWIRYLSSAPQVAFSKSQTIYWWMSCSYWILNWHVHSHTEKYLDCPKYSCYCQDLYLWSKDVNSYSSRNTSGVYIIALITQNTCGKCSINSNYVLEGKKGRGTMKSWKAIPEYLTELVIATEQYVTVKSVAEW